MQREYRYFQCELRTDPAAGNSWKVRGYAATFGNAYTLLSNSDYEIREVIDRNAFSKTDMTDTIMQYDHEGKVFARTRNGTLKLKIDRVGLYVEADLSGTKEGRRLYEEIKGGYTDKMSIGFAADKSHDVWQRTEEAGKIIETRIINKIKKLYDVSAVSIPANPDTTINA